MPYAQTDRAIRCVTGALDQPTPDRQARLLTQMSLSEAEWSAAELYRARWTMEQALPELTEAVETLAHPRGRCGGWA